MVKRKSRAKKKKVKKYSSLKKFIIAFIFLIFCGGLGMAYNFYARIFQPNIVLADNLNEDYIYIPTNSNFDNVIAILSKNGFLINQNSFEWLAIQKKYNTNIKAGRFKIKRSLNNNQLINLLRSGKQSAVKVKFNNLRTIEQLAGEVSKQIEADSLSIVNYITDSLFLDSLKINIYNVACIFIPNTYEFYWNTSAKLFVNRMLNEHSFFWNNERVNKAKTIGLTNFQVSILASIVEKEQTIRTDERQIIAGLYLNRLRKKMKLESDPTLIFALNDFSIRRVLNKDKKIKSRFNTYINTGLPPGPICIPSINSIDAVLNAIDHNYIFMCAKEDFSGYHNFSINYKTHKKYARKYQRALDKKRIMR